MKYLSQFRDTLEFKAKWRFHFLGNSIFQEEKLCRLILEKEVRIEGTKFSKCLVI